MDAVFAVANLGRLTGTGIAHFFETAEWEYQPERPSKKDIQLEARC